MPRRLLYNIELVTCYLKGYNRMEGSTKLSKPMLITLGIMCALDPNLAPNQLFERHVFGGQIYPTRYPSTIVLNFDWTKILITILIFVLPPTSLANLHNLGFITTKLQNLPIPELISLIT
ncbi:hypothetical protein YC2023_062372 [Brassica napus]